MSDIENKLNIIDSSDLLSEDDEKLLEGFIRIKRTIMSFFKIEGIVAKLKELIIDSEIFNFTSKRAEKFIDLKKPVFTMIIDREKALEKFPSEFSNEESEINWLTNCLYQEIILVFSSFLVDSVTKNDDLNESLQEIFKEEIPNELIELSTSILSSIFGIRFDLEKNLIHLEYII